MIHVRVCCGCEGEFSTNRPSAKYCSLRCLGLSRRLSQSASSKDRSVKVAAKCSGCGSVFAVSTWAIRNGTGKLCRQCITSKAGKEARRIHPIDGDKNPLWKGGLYTNDPEAWWKAWRKEYRRRTIEKCRARDDARYAKTKGLIEVRPCVDCGGTIDLQMHHEDYGKPLDVIWLCRTCHNKRHGKLKHLNAEV